MKRLDYNGIDTLANYRLISLFVNLEMYKTKRLTVKLQIDVGQAYANFK